MTQSTDRPPMRRHQLLILAPLALIAVAPFVFLHVAQPLPSPSRAPADPGDRRLLAARPAAPVATLTTIDPAAIAVRKLATLQARAVAPPDARPVSRPEPHPPAARPSHPRAPLSRTTQPHAPVAGTTQPHAPVAGTAQPHSPVAGTTQPHAPVAGTAQPTAQEPQILDVVPGDIPSTVTPYSTDERESVAPRPASAPQKVWEIDGFYSDFDG